MSWLCVPPGGTAGRPRLAPAASGPGGPAGAVGPVGAGGRAVTGVLPRGAGPSAGERAAGERAVGEAAGEPAGEPAGAGLAAPGPVGEPTTSFQLLGPLSISDGRDAVVLQPAKPTSLLAALLLNPNGVVSVGMLQQAVWGDDQPATARAALQNCVLRLRQLFARHGVANTAVQTVPGGYRVVAGPRTLDLVQFRELVRRAAAEDDPEEERHLLDEALALWRGPLLANVPSEALHRDAVPRLAEERLRAIERVSDLKLALGAARAALPELWSVARAHPGHERFSEQLIEALYRTGRQAEALAEIRRVKAYLRTELGIEAGRSLHRLELAILQGEELEPPRTVGRPRARLAGASVPGPSVPGPGSRPSGSSGSAGSSGSGEPAGPARTPGAGASGLVAEQGPVVPAPAGGGPGGDAPGGDAPGGDGALAGGGRAGAAWATADPYFTGRSACCAAIAGQLAAGPGVLVLTGPPGIGKTALALHAGQLARPAAGAQVLIGMSDPAGRPRPAGEVAAELTAFLGRARAARPAPALVVLDDVVEPEQAGDPLRACGRDAAVVLTSRRSLAGLVARHGARVYRLDTLDPAESHELLVALLGPERAGAEPAALADLAAACGHFPLALRIVGARLLTRPRMRIADAVAWLGADPIGRLAVPGDPQLSVGHRLATWLGQFEPGLVAAFVRIGGSAAATWSIDSGAALLGTTRAATEQVFDQLVDAHLLEEGPGHYTMHDLLRRFARSAAIPTG